MTIIAGFRCPRGVVLCADTQETVGDIAKRNVPKLRFEPGPHTLTSPGDIAVAFCGATNNGPFMDEIVDRAWEAVQTSTSLEEACEAVKKSIRKSYREFGQIYQDGYCPSAELIYGIKMHGGSKMFHAFGPAINEKRGYMAGGIGCYLADFLAGRMYSDYLTLRQCIILAAYVLFQAKEHVVGCGGDSEIAVLRDDGTSGTIGWQHIDVLTKLMQASDVEISKLVVEYANLDLSNEDFLKHSKEKLESIVTLRSHGKQRLKEWEDLWNGIFGVVATDSYGLPAPESEGEESSE